MTCLFHRFFFASAALGLSVGACTGSCDGPFHLTYYDPKIVATHAIVREDGAELLFGDYEYDEVGETGEVVAAAWFGVVDAGGKPTRGQNLSRWSRIGDVWQRPGGSILALLHNDQFPPSLVELDRNAAFVAVRSLALDSEYDFDGELELDGDANGEVLLWAPSRVARLSPALTTRWQLNTAKVRIAIDGADSWIARQVDGAIVLDRVDGDGARLAQVTLTVDGVRLGVSAVALAGDEPVLRLYDLATGSSTYVTRLGADLSPRWGIVFGALGQGGLACTDRDHCTVVSGDAQGHSAALTLDADGAPVNEVGWLGHTEIQRVFGRGGEVVVRHRPPIGGEVTIAAEDVSGCAGASEHLSTLTPVTFVSAPSEVPLEVVNDELVGAVDARAEAEETEELPLPRQCQ